jgi:hypothetical protein
MTTLRDYETGFPVGFDDSARQLELGSLEYTARKMLVRLKVTAAMQQNINYIELTDKSNKEYDCVAVSSVTKELKKLGWEAAIYHEYLPYCDIDETAVVLKWKRMREQPINKNGKIESK